MIKEEPTVNAELFQYAKNLGFGDLFFRYHQPTGLIAIIAIHSTKLGPALGGCRCLHYTSFDAAIQDALRLAQGMTYKSAITGLPLGGGKAVLLKPIHIVDRHKYFEAFGEFVNDVGGRYITAVDSGTNPLDMDDVARKTKYVTSTGSNGDPSPFTAHGVCLAIKAAIKFKFGKDSLNGLHVAIQGVGNVGQHLARELYQLGAKLTVADPNESLVKYCVENFNAHAVHPQEIYSVECDVFSPSALGAIINDRTITQFKTHIIVGSANNQLAEPRHGEILQKKGILYGPDYVVNAGGLICAYAQYYKISQTEVNQRIENIYNTALKIFQRSTATQRPTNIVADEIAEECLNKGV